MDERNYLYSNYTPLRDHAWGGSSIYSPLPQGGAPKDYSYDYRSRDKSSYRDKSPYGNSRAYREKDSSSYLSPHKSQSALRRPSNTNPLGNCNRNFQQSRSAKYDKRNILLDNVPTFRPEKREREGYEETTSNHKYRDLKNCRSHHDLAASFFEPSLNSSMFKHKNHHKDIDLERSKVYNYKQNYLEPREDRSKSRVQDSSKGLWSSKSAKQLRTSQNHLPKTPTFDTSFRQEDTITSFSKLHQYSSYSNGFGESSIYPEKLGSAFNLEKSKVQDKSFFHDYRSSENDHYKGREQEMDRSLSKSKINMEKSKVSAFASKTNINSKSNLDLQKIEEPYRHKYPTSALLTRTLLSQTTPSKPTIWDFDLGKSKGEGKFGTVFAAIHRDTGSLYALKKISKEVIKTHMMENQLCLQIKLQLSFNHPNIVKLYGFFDDREHIYLILEYMEEGTLFESLRKRKDRMPESEVSQRITEMSSAIKYLHESEVAHRDIKPQNIVISHKISKLCDFGWATHCTNRRQTYCGTFDYAAPEILEGKEYDLCVDLWCLGVLSFELLTGKVPFYHINRKETMKKILRVDRDQIVFPPDVSPKARDFVQSLIKKDPHERMTSDKLLEHSFLKEVKDTLF